MIEVENISVDYDGKPAVRNISFEVGEGETVAIMGVSGSGKSTILKTIAGTLEPSSGKVEFCDSPKPAYVDQRYRESVFPWLTVRQNVALGRGFRAQDDVNASLSLVNLLEHADRYPYQLSGGECQRLALARAVHFKPNVLLLDEPFASLDDFTRADLQADLAMITTDHRIASVLVTHDSEEAVLLADRVLGLAPDGERISALGAFAFRREPYDASMRFTNGFVEARKILEESLGQL